MYNRKFRRWGAVIVLAVFLGSLSVCSTIKKKFQTETSAAKEKPELKSIEWKQNNDTKEYRVPVEQIIWKSDDDAAIQLQVVITKSGEKFHTLNFSGFDHRRSKINKLPKEERTPLLKKLKYKDSAVLMQPIDESVQIAQDTKYPKVVVVFRPEDYRKALQQANEENNWTMAFIIREETDRLKVRLLGMEKDWLISLYNRARSRFEAGNYDEAIADLREYTKAKPGDFDANFLLAQAYYKIQEYDEAERILSTLIKAQSNRDKSEVYYMLGEVQLAVKKFDKAIDNLRRTAQIKEADDKPNPEIYFLLGLAHYYNKNEVEAHKNFEKFLRYDNIDPNHAEKARKFLEGQEGSNLPSTMTVAAGERKDEVPSTVLEPKDTHGSPITTGKVRISHDSVNLRQGPTKESKRLGQVYKGQIYSVLKTEDDWLHIRDAKRSVDGWVIREWEGEPYVEYVDAATKEPEPKPSYALRANLDGFNVDDTQLSDFAGKVVLLHFWATWCQPCIKELPSLSKFYRTEYPKLQKKGLTLLTISNDLREKDLEKYVKEKKLDFPIYFDSLSKLNQQFGIQGIPQTVVIGPEGRVLEKLPSQDWQNKALQKKLESFLYE